MTKARWYMGIDPGVTGALALLDGNNPEHVPRVWDLPNEQVKVGKKNRTVLNEEALVGLVDELAELYLGEGVVCVMERMTAMPNQSSQSGMSLGVTWGQLRMTLRCVGIDYMMPRPTEWKGQMGLSSNKDESLFLCLEKWPGTETIWFGPRGAMLHDRCEAALMADFGRMYYFS